MNHAGVVEAIAPGKHKALGLSAEQLLEMYFKMLLTRALDERAWALNRQGKLPIVGASTGHEAAQTGAAMAMDRGRDLFFPYYRDICLLLTVGVTAQEMMLGFWAKAGNPLSGGRQFPTHGAYPKYRIYNISNVVGPHGPEAVGAALAAKMRREPAVVLFCCGDGGTSQGDWHEAMNFAAIHRLPVVFFCENNALAISVPASKQMAVENVSDRAQGYGMPGVTVNGVDPLEVYRAVREAAERARRGEGPTLVEAKVERIMPHTSDDDDRRYRSPEELAEARKRDPIPLFRDYLMAEELLTEETDGEYRRRAQAEVDEATEFAEKAPQPDPSTLFDHLWATPPGRKGG
ncbi:MAG: thiamine pyrophosphate-dependent dehydrogenase E1 component subunit alpha [Chloroflexi bacterium]|nr:thiamine pyrophosphate-dependent dehydrogenase E1 component subunit alpha [Chloroflexota bacterium]